MNSDIDIGTLPISEWRFSVRQICLRCLNNRCRCQILQTLRLMSMPTYEYIYSNPSYLKAPSPRTCPICLPIFFSLWIFKRLHSHFFKGTVQRILIPFSDMNVQASAVSKRMCLTSPVGAASVPSLTYKRRVQCSSINISRGVTPTASPFVPELAYKLGSMVLTRNRNKVKLRWIPNSTKQCSAP